MKSNFKWERHAQQDIWEDEIRLQRNRLAS